MTRARLYGYPLHAHERRDWLAVLVFWMACFDLGAVAGLVARG